MFTKISVWMVPSLPLTNPEPRPPGAPTAEVRAAGVKKTMFWGGNIMLPTSGPSKAGHELVHTYRALFNGGEAVVIPL